MNGFFPHSKTLQRDNAASSQAQEVESIQTIGAAAAPYIRVVRWRWLKWLFVHQVDLELRKVLKEVDVIGGAVPHRREGEASENDRKEEAPEFHQWENSAGKTIKAAVTEVKGDKVLLLLTSGKSVWYDISKLSKASQLKLEKLDL